MKYVPYKADGTIPSAAKYLLRTTSQVSTGVYEILDQDELAKGIVCVVVGSKGDGSTGGTTYATVRVTGIPVDNAGNPTFDTSGVIITINEPKE